MAEQHLEGMCHSCDGIDIRDMYAWNDLMPPTPDYLHVTGEVWVPNPGTDPELLPAPSPNPNPTVLSLDLYRCQKPGVWPQVALWKPVSFTKKITDTKYAQVEIRCGGKVLTTLAAQDVH